MGPLPHMGDPKPKVFRAKQIDLGNDYFVKCLPQINGFGAPMRQNIL